MKIMHHSTHHSLCKQANEMEVGFEMDLQLPYPPDLAPSNYFLFPNFKGDCVANVEEVKLQTEAYFDDLRKLYCKEDTEKSKSRWIRCNELQDEYIEKYY